MSLRRALWTLKGVEQASWASWKGIRTEESLSTANSPSEQRSRFIDTAKKLKTNQPLPPSERGKPETEVSYWDVLDGMLWDEPVGRLPSKAILDLSLKQK